MASRPGMCGNSVLQLHGFHIFMKKGISFLCKLKVVIICSASGTTSLLIVLMLPIYLLDAFICTKQGHM